MNRILIVRIVTVAGASLGFHLAVFAAVGPRHTTENSETSNAEIHIGSPPGFHAEGSTAAGEPEPQPASMRVPEPASPEPQSAPQPEPPSKSKAPSLSPIVPPKDKPVPTEAPDQPATETTETPVPEAMEATQTEAVETRSAPSGTADGMQANAEDAGGSARGGSPDDASGGNQESASSADSAPSDPGNAASTNYAGLVMQHLSKVRRPRASSPGSAFVSFTIGQRGELEDIRISRSSRSARFDRDALKVVRRAAPFPAPPPGVNRSFSVEIEGT